MDKYETKNDNPCPLNPINMPQPSLCVFFHEEHLRKNAAVFCTL